MPLVRTIRSRGGANLVVTANAELLFTPTGDISRWNNSLSQRVRFAVAQVAPRNKRHRWSHNGTPLHKTIKATTDMQVVPGGGRAYTAVGSSAPYALFVDQGTESFMAKILPPWGPMSPSLYEHTWKVPVNDGTDPETGKGMIAFEEIGRIRVRGQKAQNFFNLGLRGGLGMMRVATREDYGSPIVAKGTATFPERMADFVTTGYNVNNAAFMANLQDWREWREDAWGQSRLLGQGYNRERERRELNYVRKGIEFNRKREQRREIRLAKRREIQRRYRRRNGAVSREEYRERQTAAARESKQNNQAKAADRAKFLAAMRKKYGKVDGDSLHFRGGRWYILVVVATSASGNNTYDEVSAPAKFPGASGAPDDDF